MEQQGKKGLSLKIRSVLSRGRSPATVAPVVSAAHFEEWDASLQKLDLRSRQLEYLPPALAAVTALTWLGLNGNRIDTLPESMTALQNLRVLRALSNRVTRLEPYMGALSALQVLDLGKNQLDFIAPAALRGMTALKELLLQWNCLSACPEEMGLCTNMRKLQLSINRLTELPASLSKLVALEELDVSHNRLVMLPDLGLTSLETLNCVGNDLRSFPSSISQLTGLTELNAQMNVVDELCPELGKLTNLRRLKLKKNLIREFPREIGDLTALEDLLISDNQFINLPRTIGQLKRLTTLRASENAFIYLPPELGQMPSLKILDLSSNQIETLPKEIGELHSLHTLLLADNALSSLPEQVGQLTSLTELNLFDNKLQDVPAALGQLKQLRMLNLSRNRISRLPEELAGLGPALETLDVACNLLSDMPAALAALPGLTQLNVACNRMLEVPWIQHASTTLRILYLGYNPLSDAAKLPLERLTELRDLNISGVGLKEVPSFLTALTLLQVLSINNNSLSSLGPVLASCEALQVLQLANNQLSSIESQPLSALRSLKELDVSHNSLVRVENGLFSLLPLQDLDLSANVLSTLPSDCGGTCMPKLTQLKLAFNALTEAPRFPSSQPVWISLLGNPIKSRAASRARTRGRLSPRHSAGSSNGSSAGADGDASGDEDGHGALYSADLEARSTKLQRKRPKSTPAIHSLTVSNPDLMSKELTAKSNSASGNLTGISNSMRLGTAPLTVGWAEMTGKRPDQQDTVAIIKNFGGDPSRAYFAVFDGHGGQTSSEYAASYLHVLLEEALQKMPHAPNEAMQMAFRSMHEEIARKEFDDGCAALVVLVTPDRIWLANSGDSRAIMCRKNRAVQISRDHKSDSLDEKRRITDLHGFVTEDRRVNGILALSRALGDVSVQPYVTYRPDVLELDVSDAIEHLILACDGLWDVVSNDQVIEVVKGAASAHEAAVKLRDMAYQLGSTDNISVIVVSFVRQLSSSSEMMI